FLRERIWFRYFNLMTEIPLQSPVDVIMCRNVFIYFTKEKQRELLSKFSRVLKPGGLLCLGHAESIDGDWQQEQGWQPLGQAMYKKTGD
ncbi:MAG: CheR family methyltransferase, partial [Limnochordia bacterium]